MDKISKFGGKCPLPILGIFFGAAKITFFKKIGKIHQNTPILAQFILYFRASDSITNRASTAIRAKTKLSHVGWL
jgi:hypothetical protein